MSTIPQVSQAMQQLLTTAALDADAKFHYTKRPDRAKFSAATLAQTLVFGFLAHPDARIEQLAQIAARVGVNVSPQAIDQRFTFDTAALLQELLAHCLQHLICAEGLSLPLLQRFSGVFVHDSTTIVLPDCLAEHWRGCGGSSELHTSAALKCGVQFDLLSGALCGVDLADGRASDQRLGVQHSRLPKGSLRLADLGFFDLNVLANLDRQGVYWLSKLQPNTVITDECGHGTPLAEFVQALRIETQWQGSVWLGKEQHLAARLLIQRVPQEVADGRRRRIRKAAREKGVMPSAMTLALAEWTVVATNCPAEMLTVSEGLVLMKARWQIELLFKLWKSHGQVDTWRTSKAARVLCEVYAKLVAMVVQHWTLVVGCWQRIDRSLVKAAQVVRDHAGELAGARGRVERLTEILLTIQQVLKRTARINPRKKKPNTYQLLLAVTADSTQA